jgi:hypothetical protein
MSAFVRAVFVTKAASLVLGPLHLGGTRFRSSSRSLSGFSVFAAPGFAAQSDALCWFWSSSRCWFWSRPSLDTAHSHKCGIVCKLWFSRGALCGVIGSGSFFLLGVPSADDGYLAGDRACGFHAEGVPVEEHLHWIMEPSALRIRVFFTILIARTDADYL